MAKFAFSCIKKLFAENATRKIAASVLVFAFVVAVVLSANTSNLSDIESAPQTETVEESTSTDVVSSEVASTTVTVNDVPVRLGSFDVIPSFGETSDDVKLEYITVTKTIEFKTIKKETSDLKAGETKVQQKGSNGTKEVTYVKEVVNGETVASEFVSEKVIKKAVDKIILVGTRYESDNAVQTSADVKCVSTLKPEEPIELDENGIPCNYTKVMKGKATAYSCGTHCSTGVRVQPGYIAVDPKIIPYGTKMYIVSDDGKYVYGYAIAADTGGFIKSGKILADLYFPTESQCVNFGVRGITIYFLD